MYLGIEIGGTKLQLGLGTGDGTLAALWRGVLYDAQALGEAERLLPKLSFAEHREFHRAAGEAGLRATLRGAPVSALAKELVQIARGGLQRLDPEDAPLLVQIDVRGARELILAVDLGELGDVQSRVTWGSARLIKSDE